MENDIYVGYDAICYATFINIKTLSGKAERIAFKNFDKSNKEHLFVIAVTMACWNILGGRSIAIDADIWTRRRLSKRYKQICKIEALTDNDENVIDIEELLEYMRGPACQTCGEAFSFADIYDEYYNEGRKR